MSNPASTSTYVYDLDEAQSHMLGLVVAIMQNYNLTPADVYEHFRNSMHHYATEASAVTVMPDDIDPGCACEGAPELPEQSVVAAPMVESPSNMTQKKYAATRREFRDAMTDGIKICPKYHICDNRDCEGFHVLPENLCTHAGRNNHCDVASCDKIVIKACRKGRRCSDSSCSFRH